MDILALEVQVGRRATFTKAKGGTGGGGVLHDAKGEKQTKKKIRNTEEMMRQWSLQSELNVSLFSESDLVEQTIMHAAFAFAGILPGCVCWRKGGGDPLLLHNP